MAYIGNSPEQRTVLRLEQRKSFALSLWFKDANRRPADLTGALVRLVVKAPPFDPNDTTDADNLIESAVAEFPAPEQGYARIELQASELDAPAGEYPFVIVLTAASGYSTVAVKGVLDLVPNPEFLSAGATYDDVQPPSALDVVLRGQHSIDVICGPLVPPGFTWMSDADKAKLDGLSIAGNLLPSGGDTRQILAKRTDDDYDFTWADPQAFDGTLDAAGVAAGRAPVSDGAGLWSWQQVPSDTSGVPAGQVPVADGSGGWGWGLSDMKAATSIQSTNLNDLLTTGRYYPLSPLYATFARNYPIEAVGLLEVFAVSTSRTVQRYSVTSTTESPRVWTRMRTGTTTWSVWSEVRWKEDPILPTEIDGELVADQVPRVIDLRGISRGTDDPTGGEDGDLYIKVLP